MENVERFSPTKMFYISIISHWNFFFVHAEKNPRMYSEMPAPVDLAIDT